MQLVITVDFDSGSLPEVSAVVDGDPVKVSDSARSLVYDLCFRLDHGSPELARYVSVGEYSPVDFTGPGDE